jgi:hypothetical protein
VDAEAGLTDGREKHEASLEEAMALGLFTRHCVPGFYESSRWNEDVGPQEEEKPADLVVFTCQFSDDIEELPGRSLPRQGYGAQAGDRRARGLDWTRKRPGIAARPFLIKSEWDVVLLVVVVAGAGRRGTLRRAGGLARL